MKIKIDMWHILIVFYAVFIVVIFLLSGCSSINTYSEYQDGEWIPRYRVITKGKAKTSLEILPDGTIKYEQDNKNEPFINIKAPDMALGKVGA